LKNKIFNKEIFFKKNISKEKFHKNFLKKSYKKICNFSSIFNKYYFVVIAKYLGMFKNILNINHQKINRIKIVNLEKKLTKSFSGYKNKKILLNFKLNFFIFNINFNKNYFIYKNLNIQMKIFTKIFISKMLNVVFLKKNLFFFDKRY
jgi:hypothetical protein